LQAQAVSREASDLHADNWTWLHVLHGWGAVEPFAHLKFEGHGVGNNPGCPKYPALGVQLVISAEPIGLSVFWGQGVGVMDPLPQK